MRRALFGALIAVTPWANAPASPAERVDLQIVFAADVSISVDNDEFRLQRDGYVDAITDPHVVEIMRSGPFRSIAVSFIEWSGASEQRLVADWTVIRDAETAEAFANILRAAPRSFIGSTAIGNAIDYAMRRFVESGIDSDRRIIDISGDGDNNNGRPVEYARDDAVAAGVTINALAIINRNPKPGFLAHIHPPGGLGEYYRTRVIGGPQSFVLVVEDYSTFAEAITNKLMREIAAAEGPHDVALVTKFDARHSVAAVPQTPTVERYSSAVKSEYDVDRPSSAASD